MGGRQKFAWGILTFSTVCCFAIAGDIGFKPQALKIGQCASDPDSKNYLASLRASGGSRYDGVKAEIGLVKLKHLKDTDDAKHYFCRVTCRESEQKLIATWVDHSDSAAHASNMNGFLCHGVSIEQVQIVGSIFGPQPVVTPFDGAQSSLPEVQELLKKANFKLPLEIARERSVEMHRVIAELIKGYSGARTSNFVSAASTLWNLNQSNAESVELFKNRLLKLRARNWQGSGSYRHADDVVDNAILQFARFTQFVDEKDLTLVLSAQ